MLTAPLNHVALESLKTDIAVILGRQDRLSFNQLQTLADVTEEVDASLIDEIQLSQTRLCQIGKCHRSPEEVSDIISDLLNEVHRQPRRQHGMPNTKAQKRKLRQRKLEQRQLKATALA